MKSGLNKVVLITRNSDEYPVISPRLKMSGWDLILLPTIKTISLKLSELEAKQITDFENVDIIIFSSANAVKVYIEHLAKLKVKPNFNKIKIAVVGNKTAEVCAENNISVSIQPETFSAHGLIEYFEEHSVRGKKILVPSSQIGRDELVEELIKLKAIVTRVAIYDVIKPPMEEIKESVEKTKNRKPDVFAFTSPSSFKNFTEILKIKNIPEYFTGTTPIAIGNTTASIMRNLGVKDVRVPKMSTIENIVEYIIQNLEFEKKSTNMEDYWNN